MLLVGLENPDMEIKLKDKTVKFKEIATTFEPISKISEKNNEFWKLTVEGEEWLKQIQ